MESIYRISDQKMNAVDADGDPITSDDVVKDLVRCGYLKSADLADRFGNPSTLDPAGDPEIVGATGIGFTANRVAGIIDQIYHGAPESFGINGYVFAVQV